MGNLSEQANGTRIEVAGMVPAEILKNKDMAQSLKDALSLNVKDENPEQRKARIIRRKLICNTFGISTKNIDEFLKDLDNNILNMSDNPLDNDQYLKSKDDDKKNQAKKNAEKTFSLGISVITSFFPQLKILSFVYNGVKILVDNIKETPFANDGMNGKMELDALKVFAEKVSILNDKIDEKMDEILANKKNMKPKAFAAYKKDLIASIREEMKEYGVEIDISAKENKLEEKTNPAPDTEGKIVDETKPEDKKEDEKSEEQESEPGE